MAHGNSPRPNLRAEQQILRGRATGQNNRLPQTWRILTMQMPDTFSVLEYDRTLVLAIELSSKFWVVAAQVPGLPHAKAKRTVKPTVEALIAAIDGYRSRATAAGRIVERVIATYEAGWSGFWLARWLARRGVETYVIQPSSVPVDRRARRA